VADGADRHRTNESDSDAAVVQALPAVPFRQDGQGASPVVRQMANDDQSAATLPLFRLQPAVLERATATNRARLGSLTDDWCPASVNGSV